METTKQQVLIIDDDERNIFALKAVLTARGFRCSSAASGLEALELMKQHKDIGVALVDMMMPGMDGYELMKLVRKISSLDHLQLIAVTAQAMPGDKEKCLQAGASLYISKPVDIDALVSALNKTVKQGG